MMVTASNSGANFLDEYPILLPSTMLDVDNSNGALGHVPVYSYQTEPRTASYTETQHNANMHGAMIGSHLPMFSSAAYHASGTEPYKFSYNSQEMNPFSIVSALSESQCVAKQTLSSPTNPSQTELTEEQGKVAPPTIIDIVCSRESATFRFRQIIHQSVQEYIDAETRMDKSIVIDSIIDSVRAQDESRLVRFMKFHCKSNTWSELPLEQIRDKVSHALRDAMGGLDRKKSPTF